MLKTSMSQKIFTVQFEFFQTGTSNTGKFQFKLLGSSRTLLAFSNILDSRSCCLNHLIVSSTFDTYVPITKANRYVINQLCDLKAFQFSISVMRWNELLFRHALAFRYFPLPDLTNSTSSILFIAFSLTQLYLTA